MRPSHILAVLCTLTACGLSAPARAQDIAAAKVMFDQGLADMEARNYEKGCPAIEASYKLDPRPGTLFTLAECENQRGRIATAVARYKDYLAMFARLAPEQQRKQGAREKIARDQQATLAPQVPELTLALPPDAPRDTLVKRDGTELTAAMLGLALPVDPGEHLGTTQVPGGVMTKLQVTIGKGERRQVTLQVKAAALTAQSTQGNVPDAVPQPRSRVPAVVMGTAALTAVGVGAGLFAVSQKKRADTFALAGTIGRRNGSCVDPPIDQSCDEVVNLARQSDTFHNVAVSTFIGAGVLAVGALTYLLWPAPRPTLKKTPLDVHASPVVGSRDGAMMLWGTF